MREKAKTSTPYNWESCYCVCTWYWKANGKWSSTQTQHKNHKWVTKHIYSHLVKVGSSLETDTISKELIWQWLVVAINTHEKLPCLWRVEHMEICLLLSTTAQPILHITLVLWFNWRCPRLSVNYGRGSPTTTTTPSYTISWWWGLMRWLRGQVGWKSWTSTTCHHNPVWEDFVYRHHFKLLDTSPEVSVIAFRHCSLLASPPVGHPGVIPGVVRILERERGQCCGGIGVVPQLVVKLTLSHCVLWHGVSEMRVTVIELSVWLEWFSAGVKHRMVAGSEVSNWPSSPLTRASAPSSCLPWPCLSLWVRVSVGNGTSTWAPIIVSRVDWIKACCAIYAVRWISHHSITLQRVKWPSLTTTAYSVHFRVPLRTCRLQQSVIGYHLWVCRRRTAEDVASWGRSRMVLVARYPSELCSYTSTNRDKCIVWQ